MSRVFNDTTNLDGLVQKYEEEIGANLGDISGNTTKLKQFTSKTRSAWDTYLTIAIQASGRHQFDDSGYTDYPFIETDLVANQRDYTVLTDDNNALVLDIFKVMVKDSSGVYFEATPIDQQLRGEGVSIWDGQDTTGTPQEYDKTGNGIIFDVLPDYSWRNDTEGEYGIKLFVNREANYFTFSDTTTKPGCPGIHHDYFYLKPAMEYARSNGLANYNQLRDAVFEFEGDEERGIQGKIAKYFAKRSRDERSIMRPKKINYI